MRVAILALPEGTSGIATYTRQLTTALSESGHDVAIVHLGKRPAELPDAITQLLLPSQAGNPWARASMPARHMRHLGERAPDAVSRWEPDVVHVTFPPIGAGFQSPAPSAATSWFVPHNLIERLRIMHRFAPRAPLASLQYLREQVNFYRLDERCFRRCDAVIALTRMGQTSLASQGFHVERIPPGVDPSQGSDSGRRREDSDRHLISVANNLEEPRKGLAYLLRAVGLLKTRSVGQRLVLDLVGRYSARLPALLGDLQLLPLCRLHGFCTGSEYRALLRDGSLYVSTSLYEEWGYSMVEAMNAGLPVVAFSHQASRDILSPTTGILVEPRDVAGFADAVESVLASRETARAMGNAAADRIKAEDSWARVIPELETLYRKLVAEAARTAA